MTYALDTNLLLRLLLQDIPSQAKQVEAMMQAGQCHVADVAIVEMVHVLSSFYEFTQEEIAQAVKLIVGNKNINCNKMMFSLAIEAFVKSPKVSFVDTCLVTYAKLQNAKLATFDKKLAKKFPKDTHLISL